MPLKNLPESKHFTNHKLTDGIYACVHKPGGAAYSTAGIIDLGETTLLVDAFNTMTAGIDLRLTAEGLFNRQVDAIVLTHPHSDHWIGASAFEEHTKLISTETVRQVCQEWGADIVAGYQDQSGWEEWVTDIEAQLQTEQDERVRLGLEKSLLSARYTMAEMEGYVPRYADQTFEHTKMFRGEKRCAEFLSLGRGHSEEDSVLLLPDDGIAFIGDIGFFGVQPFLGFCDIDLYRKQVAFFLDSEYEVLIPGHGSPGGKEELALQSSYFDVMEDLVGDVVKRGGVFEEAKEITLPEPFASWLFGGMARFEANIRYLYGHLGGELQEEE
jgi:glyoxylase-like metal-dependent hydrolase (beta-lactamase superfamily II)